MCTTDASVDRFFFLNAHQICDQCIRHRQYTKLSAERLHSTESNHQIWWSNIFIFPSTLRIEAHFTRISQLHAGAHPRIRNYVSYSHMCSTCEIVSYGVCMEQILNSNVEIIPSGHFSTVEIDCHTSIQCIKTQGNPTVALHHLSLISIMINISWICIRIFSR